MRLTTTYAKLAIALLLLIAVLTAGVVWLTLRTTRTYVDDVEQRLHAELAAHLAEEEPLLTDGEPRKAALKRVFHMLMVVNPRIECYLLGPEGAVLAYDAPEGTEVASRVDLAPIRRFLGEERRPIHGTDPRAPGVPKIFSVAPLGDSGEPSGYLYVVLGGEQYLSVVERLRSSLTLRVGLVGSTAILVLVALMGLTLSFVLTRRLRRLDRAVEAFAASGFSDPPPVLPRSRFPDEIDRLSARFDTAARTMVDQLGRIRRGERERRDLVANVSHDLRTPITTLTGYLETLLLRGAELDPSERLEYTRVAHGNARRLGRLVEDFFELARLDSAEPALRIEAFNLSELAQDMTLGFALRAREEGVELRTDLDPAVPLVQGDIRLIERTLENLVANALRHTPAGGEVAVSVRSGARGVEVDVSDTGCGIAEDELETIFDRFCRGRDGSAGGGLGLAISQRAVQLHQAELHVESVLGKGTTFRFTLSVELPLPTISEPGPAAATGRPMTALSFGSSGSPTL